MKKIIALMLCAVMAFALFACASKDNDTTAGANTEPQTTVTDAATDTAADTTGAATDPESTEPDTTEEPGTEPDQTTGDVTTEEPGTEPESTEPVTTEEPTTTAPETTTQKSNELNYTTNDEKSAKNGNTGVYAYKKSGSNYDIYYIIDFNEGYVYRFLHGEQNSTCDKNKIVSGTLNDTLIIEYEDGGVKWANALYFKLKNHPEQLTLEDNDHFTYSFNPTDLKDALKIRDKMTIVDYSPKESHNTTAPETTKPETTAPETEPVNEIPDNAYVFADRIYVIKPEGYTFKDFAGSPSGLKDGVAEGTCFVNFSLIEPTGVMTEDVARNTLEGQKATIGDDYTLDSFKTFEVDGVTVTKLDYTWGNGGAIAQSMVLVNLEDKTVFIAYATLTSIEGAFDEFNAMIDTLRIIK